MASSTWRRCQYWHVELDGHDVLLADGVEAESYQDTGNRDGFDATNVVSLHPHPGAELPLDGVVPEPCLPYGTPGAALRTRLRARAEALGWTLSEDPAPWLEVAGARIEPVRRGDRLRFALPSGHARVRLRSRSVRPRDVGGCGEDARRLGLSLHRLVLVTSAGPREVSLGHPLLAEGFSYVEREDGWCWRWTDGDALLPLAALVPGRAVTAVEIAVDGGPAFWVPLAAPRTAAGPDPDEQPAPERASGTHGASA